MWNEERQTTLYHILSILKLLLKSEIYSLSRLGKTRSVWPVQMPEHVFCVLSAFVSCLGKLNYYLGKSFVPNTSVEIVEQHLLLETAF